MLRQWVLSTFMFITAIATTVFGQVTQQTESSPKTVNVVETEVTYVKESKYTYDQRLPDLTTTTTVKTDDHTSNEINETKTCPQYEEMFREYGLKPVKVFSYIAWRESGCRPKAVNAKWDENGNITWTLNKDGSIDRGLLQINSTWKTVTANACGSVYGDMEVLYDLDCNLRVAKYLLDNGGLGHWGM